VAAGLTQPLEMIRTRPPKSPYNDVTGLRAVGALLIDRGFWL